MNRPGIFAILFPMPPRFLYFDLGKVLVHFSTERMLEQMAAVSGVSTEAVREAIFSGGLLREHELGRIDARDFHAAYCRATGSRPDFDSRLAAMADIFSLNIPALPIVAQLRQAGYAMGILSNTSETHWEHCRSRYRIVAEGFDVFALSCRIGAMKPDAEIFRAAAELAGCPPEDIFFVDDYPGHVAGARAAGFDAVQFTTAVAVAEDLRRRGIRFNY